MEFQTGDLRSVRSGLCPLLEDVLVWSPIHQTVLPRAELMSNAGGAQNFGESAWAATTAAASATGSSLLATTAEFIAAPPIIAARKAAPVFAVLQRRLAA